MSVCGSPAGRCCRQRAAQSWCSAAVLGGNDLSIPCITLAEEDSVFFSYELPQEAVCFVLDIDFGHR